MAASTHDSGQNKRLQWSGVTGRVLMESQLTPPTEPKRSGPEIIGTRFDVERDSCSCSAQRCSCS